MKKIAKIVILAGQSNAVGVGHISCLPLHFSSEKIAEYEQGYDKIMINYYSHDKRSDGFVPTGMGCTEKNKRTVGPELGMAEYFSEKYPNEDIFIVKCAFGGTAICSGDWLSPSNADIGDYESTKHSRIGGIRERGWCYNELIHVLRESIDILEGKGYEPKFCGFCWMQGESDAFSPETAAAYIGKYDRLLGDIVSNFKVYFEDCIFIDAAISERWPYAKQINIDKKGYAEAQLCRRYVDTVAAGLTTEQEPIEEPDVAHYDSDSVIMLGKLFASEIGI